MTEHLPQIAENTYLPTRDMNILERILSEYSIQKCIKLLGVFQTIHRPVLILFPFVYDNYIFDLLYLNYFFTIILSYTWLKQECPISFLAKYIENPNYILGSRLNYFPEMNGICSQPTYFFMTTSIGYAFSILHIIQRLGIPYELMIIPTTSIVFYLGFPENKRHRKDFLVYQEIVKHIMMISIIFTTNAIVAFS